MRSWTSKSGGHKTTAEFVSATATEVRLRREDKSEYSVAIDKLSRRDQAYIAGRLKPVNQPAESMLVEAVKKVDRMEQIAIAALVADPEMSFSVADFTGGIAQLVHGGAEMRVGGFAPEPGFGYGVVRIQLTAVKAPAQADVCGFYLESPRGTRYPVHLLVVGSPGGEGGKRTLSDVRSMVMEAATAETVIDNTYVFMIPQTADFLKFRLGFESPQKPGEAKKDESR